MAKFELVASVKFEVLLPTAYIDPTGTPRYVQLVEVARYLGEMTAKYTRYGGYTISNPVAPPPYAGAYQGEPQERNFWAMIIVPDHLLNQAEDDIQRMIGIFQDKYHQKEILCYRYSITRYLPMDA